MIRPRLTVCLLIQGNGLVKTLRFGDPKYVGDPLNAVRIFNEKTVDEIVLLDIKASAEGRSPNFKLISQLATECNMPLCYGGGINSVEHIKELISLGVEKVAMGAAIAEHPELIPNAAEIVGRQSIVAVIDVGTAGLLKRKSVFVRNGTKNLGVTPLEMAKRLEQLDVGELLINSIDRDGVMQGYDFDLITQIAEQVSLPITCLGGAGNLDHVRELYDTAGLVAAGAGSMFVFKGKYRAVLLNYPNREEKSDLFADFTLS